MANQPAESESSRLSSNTTAELGAEMFVSKHRQSDKGYICSDVYVINTHRCENDYLVLLQHHVSVYFSRTSWFISTQEKIRVDLLFVPSSVGLKLCCGTGKESAQRPSQNHSSQTAQVHKQGRFCIKSC